MSANSNFRWRDHIGPIVEPEVLSFSRELTEIRQKKTERQKKRELGRIERGTVALVREISGDDLANLVHSLFCAGRAVSSKRNRKRIPARYSASLAVQARRQDNETALA
jgi:hypothetical protein